MESTSIVTKAFFAYFVLSLHFAFSASTELVRGSHIETLEVACRQTSYRNLCIRSLQSFSRVPNPTPYLWARGGMVIAIEGVKDATNNMGAVKNAGKLRGRFLHALSDCLRTSHTSVHALQNSLDVIRRLNSSHFQRQMTEVLAWINSSIKDMNTCANKVKGAGRSVENVVLHALHVTHNALDLARHLATSGQFTE